MQNLDLLAKDKLPNNYVSADFSMARHDSLNLIGAELGQDIIVHTTELSLTRKMFHSFIDVAQLINRCVNRNFYYGAGLVLGLASLRFAIC